MSGYTAGLDQPWPALLDMWTMFAAAPAHAVEAAAVRAMTTLRDLLPATYCLLMFGTKARGRAPGRHAIATVGGWRPCGMLRDPDEPPERRAIRDAWTAEGDHARDLGVWGLVAGTGRPRALRQQELCPPEAWEASPSRELLHRIGAADRMVVGVPLTADVEVFMAFDRQAPADLFDDAAKHVALTGLLGLAPGLHLLARLFGFDDGKPTTPREREVLGALLTGASEKEIADALGLTVRSTHQRVVGIYRKLGVHSRAELMARFLDATCTMDRHTRGHVGPSAADQQH